MPNPIVLDTIAALRTTPDYGTGVTSLVTGYYSKGDGGGGEFFWNSSSTLTDNGGSIIQVTGVSTGRWIRVLTQDIYNVLEWGMKADNSTDNTTVFNTILSTITTGQSISIFFPKGTYRFASKITITDKPVYIYGESGSFYNSSLSNLRFDAGIDGLEITRSAAAWQKARLENFAISAAGKSTVGKHGLTIKAVSYVTNVSVGGFTGDGFHVEARVIDTPPHDASLSKFLSCESSGNGGNGFSFLADDANQCFIANCDARDNDGYGFDDSSFLGNQFYACHGNQNDLGHYRTTNLNNRSTFFGCYGESGSPASAFTGRSILIGGIHENGVSGASYLEGDFMWNKGISFLKKGLTGQTISISLHEGQMDWAGESGPSYSWKSIGEPGVTHFDVETTGGADSRAAEFLAPLAVMNSPEALSPSFKRGAAGGANYNFRRLFSGSSRISPIYGTIAELVAVSPYYRAVPFTGGDIFQKGDFLFTSQDAEGATKPHYYKCVSNGTIGTYSEGRTAISATVNGFGGSDVTLNAATSVLKPGDTLTINGVSATVYDINAAKTVLICLAPNFGTISTPKSIAYTAPKFRAGGHGHGTTANRPGSLLTSDDAGFQYFDSTLGIPIWWTGSTWVNASGTSV